MCCIEKGMLKKHRASKACCHMGDLEGSDVRMLLEVGHFLKVKKVK